MLARLEGNMAAREKIAIRRAVITYYRRHARNPKITLKQVCEELGLNYQTVKNYKAVYDTVRKKPKPKK